MKKFITVFFAFGFLILTTFSCKDDVTSSNAQQPNCVPSGPHLVNIWDMCEIAYYVDPSVPTQFVSKIQAAFDAWTVHTRITFYPTSSSQSKVKFIFRAFTDSEYVNFRKNNICGVDEPYALTTLFIPNPPVNPNVEIVFNLKINWDNYDPSKGDSINFQPTATHEIGHALGLKHIDNLNALMYCCNVGQTSLHQIDIDAIEDILNVCNRCAGFQPIGEIFTFGIVGTSLAFSVFSEEVIGPVAGFDVYRSRRSDNPVGFGLYTACDSDDGEMAVATDWWELGNPGNHGRHFFVPPLSLPCIYYRAVIGANCEWIGTLGGDNEREVATVVAYETITVPYGTFNSMKVRDTRYGSSGNILWDDYLWINQDFLLLKSENVSGGDAIELISYTPPSNSVTKGGFTGLTRFRNQASSINKKSDHTK